MISKQNVTDTLVAISSVRRRAQVAFDRGDLMLHNKLMGDLGALEAVLVGLTQQLIDDLDNEALKLILEREAA